jgi:glycosyltransferase involved in cell wall biosynthesis
MKTTVILCTYNRCQILGTALSSVAAQKLPEALEWEVLVVDNNSSDQTREVVESFCMRYPGRFRYLFEPVPGKSYALNSGVRAARGEILAFMDDDATVEPMWLQNLTGALHDGAWAGAGGRTLLAGSFSPPPWLALDGPYPMGGALAGLFDLGDKPRELHVAPNGNNMAFQKKMFDAYGLFRTDLGPSPHKDIPHSNEDTEFGRRLMAAGEKLRYEPSAVVYHPALKDRIHKDYFLVWWFDHGRALIREKGRRPPVWGIPRHYLSIPKMIGIHLSVRVARWMWTLNPRRRFSWKCGAWVMAGEIVETYRLARDVARQNDNVMREGNLECSGRT